VASGEASASEILQRHAAGFSQYLQVFIDSQTASPPRLCEAIAYSLLAGGKRLRPALVLESHRACTALKTSLEYAPDASALAAAAAVELIHTFSLVHDDLPAMDDDDLRRGRPTNHKVFGEAMAILAGDAMVTMAFELLAREASPTVAIALVRELSSAAGPAGMIGGQVLDMAAENQQLALRDLQQIHHMKTAALLKASCRMGAIAAGASDQQLAALTDYGEHLGLAFQIVDDLLDVTSTSEQLGKRTRKDASRGKTTYPSLLGEAATRTAATNHLKAAVDALKPFGSAGQTLAELARFVVERTS
jgi:geranylgeranyl pyrophosphate synthase